MTTTERRWSDERVETLVSRLLQLGVALAAAVVILGGALLLAQHGHEVHSYVTFRGQPPMLRSIGGIVRGAVVLQSEAIVQLGLVLLIATPVARVAFTLVAFLVQRDRTYVVITAVVLALLLYGLLLGKA